MNSFSPKRVFTTVKNNFRINKSIPLLIFILTAILMFLATTLPVSNAEDGYVARVVDFERHSWYLSRIEDAWEGIVGIHGIQATVAAIAAIGSALLCSITLTGYQREKRACDFWNSQPVTRREHLTANLISGFLYYLVSIVPTWFLSLAIAHIFTTEPPLSLGRIFALQTPPLLFLLLFYVSVLAVGFLAATVAGSVMSILVFFATFLGYPALMILFTGVVSNDIFNTELMNMLEHDYRIFAYSSPVLRYFFGFSKTYPLETFDYILYGVLTVAVIVLLFFLVNMRKNEFSQEAVVFPILRYPLQYVWTFLFSLFLAWFLYNVRWSPVWFVIGAVIGLLLSFIILNMIFERSFTGLFKKPLHLIVCSFAFGVFVLVLVADIFGMYKKPAPDFNKVYDVSIYYSHHEGNDARDEWYHIDSTDENPVSTKLDREMVEELYDWTIRKNQDRGDYSDDGSWYNVNLTFWCEGDPSGWHANTGFHQADAELFTLMEYFKARFDVYGEEKDLTSTKEITISDVSAESIGIIGGADGPTAVFVSE